MLARRAAWVLLFCALLPLGAIELHPPGGIHDGYARSDVEINLSAQHPGHPAHLETGQASLRPVCSACVVRLQTGGAYLRPVAVVAPPSPRGIRTAERIVWPACAGGRRTCARGPPSFS